MPKASRKQAAVRVLNALLQRPHRTDELDAVLGWRNSPEAVRSLRHQGIAIMTSYNSGDRRGIYSLPHAEKHKVYEFLGKTSCQF
ncbi:MAG: hypothetical protein RI964_2517 [Pseudomonadota bacterium]|jgi:hypothetical protein